MPTRKKSVKSETVKYAVEYKALPGSRMNALRFILDLKTTPHLITAMQCGCVPKFEDPSPYDTAAAAALLMTLNENMIVFKKTKNQMIEMKAINSGGQMAISFSLPASLASVRQAMGVIKKSITAKLVKRAYKLLAAQNKEHKKNKEQIMDTVADRLNKGARLTVFGKVAASADNRKKIDTLITKLKDALPSRLEGGNSVVRASPQEIKAPEVYHAVEIKSPFPVAFVAIIAAAMQNAGIDFYTDPLGRKLFVNKEYLTATHLNPVKQFISSRLRFITGSDTSAKVQKAESTVHKLAQLVHQQAAFVSDQYDSFGELVGIKRQIVTFMKSFSDIFRP